MSTLTFNIETAGDPNLPKILLPNNDDIKTGNCKDENKLKVMREEKLAKAMEKLSLRPLTGIPICLALKLDDEPTQTKSGTPDVICLEFCKAIESVMSRGSVLQLVSFNGKAFDLPYLAVTSARLGIGLSLGRLDDYLSPYNHERHLDVYTALSPQGGGTLGDWSVRMGFKEPFGKGEFVGEWYRNGEMDKIKRHCKENVDRTFDLAQVLKKSWGV